MKNRPIGIFDSGLGGLTVVKSIRQCLPSEDIVYYGDTARVPYGNKSRTTIVRFAHEIMAFMMKARVKMVVVACNTASSLSLRSLKKTYPIPVIGVISPGVREALSVSKNKRIGIIGTKSTINSKSYEKEILKLGGKACRFFSKSCPLFVPLVENKFLNNKITYDVAQHYLGEFKSRDIDTLILGCTHYPILKQVIKKVMGNINLVDSSFVVSKEVQMLLDKKDLTRFSKKTQGTLKIFVSDDVEGFRSAAGIFLKEKIMVKKVVL
ncbi:MAG: glutamate racemase [Candidatus Omnitrophica bacterium]|nr:glutamate racemase [Candidatus Omnitrophota bacterium]MBU1895098.1 glutamate racemase [Candidatus Omnitrophota bacterium]